MYLTIMVDIPVQVVDAIGQDRVCLLLKNFIEEGEGIEFLKEKHEQETGEWIDV